MTVHLTKALERLPQQLRDKDNLSALVTVLVEPADDLEAALVDLLTERTVDTAVGAQLRVIGRLVGQYPAGEASDDLYRRKIRARIATNKSRGTTQALLNITRLVINDSTVSVVLAFQGHKEASIELVGPVLDSVQDILASFIRKAAAAGERIVVISSPEAAVDVFSLQGGRGKGFHYPARLQLLTLHLTTLVMSRLVADGENYPLQLIGDSAINAGQLVETTSGAVFHFKPGTTTCADFEAAISTSAYMWLGAAGTAGTLTAPGDEFSDVLTGYIAGGKLKRSIE